MKTLHIGITTEPTPELEREIVSFLTVEGRKLTLDEFRKLCSEARSRGLQVFPPCDHTSSTGHCLGHDPPEYVTCRICGCGLKRADRLKHLRKHPGNGKKDRWPKETLDLIFLDGLPRLPRNLQKRGVL